MARATLSDILKDKHKIEQIDENIQFRNRRLLEDCRSI